MTHLRKILQKASTLTFSHSYILRGKTQIKLWKDDYYESQNQKKKSEVV